MGPLAADRRTIQTYMLAGQLSRSVPARSSCHFVEACWTPGEGVCCTDAIRRISAVPAFRGLVDLNNGLATGGDLCQPSGDIRPTQSDQACLSALLLLHCAQKQPLKTWLVSPYFARMKTAVGYVSGEGFQCASHSLASWGLLVSMALLAIQPSRWQRPVQTASLSG